MTSLAYYNIFALAGIGIGVSRFSCVHFRSYIEKYPHTFHNLYCFILNIFDSIDLVGWIRNIILELVAFDCLSGCDCVLSQ